MPLPDSAQAWRSRLAKELSGAERLFVLGVGNRRKADDGAGCRLISHLKQELRKQVLKDIQVLDAGEVPENATGTVRRFDPTHVLIVDAAIGGYEPGRVFMIDRRKVRRDDLSTHRIPLVQLIRFLEQSMKCRVILVGIEPKVIAWNHSMSRIVRNAADGLAPALIEIWKEIQAEKPPFSPHRGPRKKTVTRPDKACPEP